MSNAEHYAEFTFQNKRQNVCKQVDKEKLMVLPL